MEVVGLDLSVITRGVAVGYFDNPPQAGQKC